MTYLHTNFTDRERSGYEAILHALHVPAKEMVS